MRLIGQFEKGEELKFISHLDLMRAFQRAIRRAGVPILYSQGFNPHMELAFATALPVGAKSVCECVDIRLTHQVDVEGIMEKLNATLPAGLKLSSMRMVEDTYPRLMAIVERGVYKLTDIDVTKDELDGFLAQNEILVDKKTKSGMKSINIRPHIFRCDMDDEGITVTLSAGATNIRPELFINALQAYTGKTIEADVLRTQLLTLNGGQWVNPLEL